MGSTVFLFHGTEGHPDNYWLGWLNAELSADGHQVIALQFPSPPNDVPANVGEWHHVLSDHVDKVNENTLLIGHSLGGVFAFRVLEKLQSKVKATAIVASPVGVAPIIDFERAGKFSGYEFDWPTIAKNSDHFLVFYGKDDPYVAIGNGELAAKKLGTDLIVVPNAGHFNSDSGYCGIARSLRRGFARPIGPGSIPLSARR